MKNLSSWLITIFIIMFWGFRVVVAITGAMGKEFMVQPIDNNIEIILLFVVLFCIPFIFKRKLLGAIIYLVAYGSYFGKALFENIMQMINGETLTLDTYTNMFFLLIAVALPIFALFDILLDKNRMKNPVDKKTDWFYKNEQYDRKLDERADKNNYRNY
jgi:hypothetical protein